MLRFHLSRGLKHRARIHVLRAADDALSLSNFSILWDLLTVVKISSCFESSPVSSLRGVFIVSRSCRSALSFGISTLSFFVLVFFVSI